MPKKYKKTKAKVKNVSQTVIVNVGKGRKSSAPTIPRPTPLQQALQFVQATKPQQGESLVQSSQLLQRLLEPTNRKLEALLQQRQQMQPNINVPINLPSQPININQPINLPSQHINVPINLPSQPININLPAQRERVLDQPDAPLVPPPSPLVPAGPQRLDNPHEDVPISSISLVSDEEEYVAEEKQEAKQLDSETQQLYDDIRHNTVDSKKDFTTKPKIRDLAKELGISISRGSSKSDIALLIARQYSNDRVRVMDALNRIKI